jgi:hypothetical protein
MCFVAKATFCKDAVQATECATNYCYSTPLCVRFNFKGRSPAFISPTPLEENALDQNGQVLKGYTDIGACRYIFFLILHQ